MPSPIKINGEIVPPELIEEERVRLQSHPDLAQVTDSIKRSLLLLTMSENSAIDRVLIKQEVDKDQDPIPPEWMEEEIAQLQRIHGSRQAMDENWRASVERRLRLDRTLERLAGRVREPSNEEIRAHYDAHRERFRHPEEIHAVHIVKHVNEHQPEAVARAGAERALAELQSGASFNEVANRHSDCKSNGSDLGYFRRGAMFEEFDRVVFALRPGQRSGIFRTPMGFHIAEVRGHRPDRPADFREARPQVERELSQHNAHAALRRGLDHLRAESLIERELAHVSAS